MPFLQGVGPDRYRIEVWPTAVVANCDSGRPATKFSLNIPGEKVIMQERTANQLISLEQLESSLKCAERKTINWG